MTTMEQFLERCRELTDLNSSLSILAWDQETKMPSKGSEFRARQRATIATIAHERLVSPELGALICRLEQAPLDAHGAANVREMKKQYEKARKIPAELVQDLAETTALAYEKWVNARQAADFSIFAPSLRKIIELKRREAAYLDIGESPYHSLLDEYEPDMAPSQLDQLFQVLRPMLTDLVERITHSAASSGVAKISGHYPVDKQEDFGRRVLERMGFDPSAGRLDISPHPFCVGMNPLDVRITTRYDASDFTGSLFGIIHEGGHALYEQGLDSRNYGQPICDSVSLGIHESQSRLWENQIARGRNFWRFWFPKLKAQYPGQLDGMDLDEFLLTINRVAPTMIRVEADEVTYGLHIILRYEIEKELLAGELEVEDLPSTWNSRMEEYLGVVPNDDAQGVLQDTHWSQGLFGYFPTYLLGNLYASQFLVQAKEDLPGLEEQVADGQLQTLREWLRENIHLKGRLHSAEELVRMVTGRPPDSKYFIDYLEQKYSKLYDL